MLTLAFGWNHAYVKPHDYVVCWLLVLFLCALNSFSLLYPYTLAGITVYALLSGHLGSFVYTAHYYKSQFVSRAYWICTPHSSLHPLTLSSSLPRVSSCGFKTMLASEEETIVKIISHWLPTLSVSSSRVWTTRFPAPTTPVHLCLLRTALHHAVHLHLANPRHQKPRRWPNTPTPVQ